MSSSRPFLALCAVAAVAALTAGCGDDESSSPPTTDAEGTTTEDDRAADEADVLAAYQAQWDGYIAAGDPPDPDAEEIAEHATGDVLEGTRDVLRQFEAEGVVVRGSYETDGVVAQLNDDRAVVEDCGLDQIELIVAATGAVVEDSDDIRDGLVVELVLEDGTWKVSKLSRDEGVCAQ